MKKTKISHVGSKSLWNYTLSPGWTKEEVNILKLALQRFGIGRWKKIIQSDCLPGKAIGQIYLQTQRIIGQQSLGDFMGLHIDIESVFIDNISKTGVERKNNCIINTGDNPTREQRMKNIEENRKKYGLSKEYVRSIKLPKQNNSQFKNTIMLEEIESNKFSTIEKIHHLIELKKAVKNKIEFLGKRGVDEEEGAFFGNMAPKFIEYAFEEEDGDNEQMPANGNGIGQAWTGNGRIKVHSSLSSDDDGPLNQDDIDRIVINLGKNGTGGYFVMPY